MVLTQNRLRHIDHRRDEDSQHTHQGRKGRSDFDKTKHVPGILAKLFVAGASISFIYTPYRFLRFRQAMGRLFCRLEEQNRSFRPPPSARSASFRCQQQVFVPAGFSENTLPNLPFSEGRLKRNCGQVHDS